MIGEATAEFFRHSEQDKLLALAELETVQNDIAARIQSLRERAASDGHRADAREARDEREHR